MDRTLNQPSFKILICLIEIWTLKDPKKPMEGVNQPRVVLTEVENIEIVDSYESLINTASVRFPRGTIIKKTITEENVEELADIKTVSAKIDNGVLVTTRVNSKLAEVSDFRVGDRIRIRLGYTTDPQIAALPKIDENGFSIYNNKDKFNKYKSYDGLSLMFDGYIVKCSAGAPIELKCEDLASGLKKISCPNVPLRKNCTVNDFLSEKGQYKLLEHSGLKLSPQTESCNISIGSVKLTTDLVVADVLTTWQKYKLFTYVRYENDEPCIAVSRSYFSNPGKDSVIDGEIGDVPVIYANYNVASDNLTLMDTDKNFVAVEASAIQMNEKTKYLTVRANPDYDESKPDSKKWQVLNEITLSKKSQKAGAISKKKNEQVDLSAYTIIPYMSRKIGATHEELVEEAIKYLESYNANGIEGSLTLFGDLKLTSGQKVKFIDDRYPEKNGYYLLSEVSTTFGTGGFRQTIKMPYLIAKIKDNEKTE